MTRVCHSETHGDQAGQAAASFPFFPFQNTRVSISHLRVTGLSADPPGAPLSPASLPRCLSWPQQWEEAWAKPRGPRTWKAAVPGTAQRRTQLSTRARTGGNLEPTAPQSWAETGRNHCVLPGSAPHRLLQESPLSSLVSSASRGCRTVKSTELGVRPEFKS